MAKISNDVFFVMKRAGRMAFDHAMLKDGMRAVVGVSGGAASSALLKAMYVRIPRTPIRYTLVAVHVQDGRHGDEEQVTQALRRDAESMGLEFHVVAGAAAEAAGAIPHHALLLECARMLQCNTILLGHHLVDAAAEVWGGLVSRRKVCTLPAAETLEHNGVSLLVGRPLLDILPEPLDTLCLSEGLCRFSSVNPKPEAAMTELLRHHASAHGNEAERLRNLRDAPTQVKDEYLV